MNNRTVPCPQPQICGVTHHVVGSDQSQMCGTRNVFLPKGPSDVVASTVTNGFLQRPQRTPAAGEYDSETWLFDSGTEEAELGQKVVLSALGTGDLSMLGPHTKMVTRMIQGYVESGATPDEANDLAWQYTQSRSRKEPVRFPSGEEFSDVHLLLRSEHPVAKATVDLTARHLLWRRSVGTANSRLGEQTTFKAAVEDHENYFENTAPMGVGSGLTTKLAANLQTEYYGVRGVTPRSDSWMKAGDDTARFLEDNTLTVKVDVGGPRHEQVQKAVTDEAKQERERILVAQEEAAVLAVNDHKFFDVKGRRKKRAMIRQVGRDRFDAIVAADRDDLDDWRRPSRIENFSGEAYVTDRGWVGRSKPDVS